MRDRPNGARLLAQARATLLEILLPALPKDKQFEARLTANAIAIAAREIDTGQAPLDADLEALADLFSERDLALTANSETGHEALERLSWRVAAEIRAGRRDGDAKLYEILLRSVTWRVAETNPRVLNEPARKRD